MKSKLMSMYLPNRDELSFLLVLALPNDSISGLVCSSRSLIRVTSPDEPLTAATYLRKSEFDEVVRGS